LNSRRFGVPLGFKRITPAVAFVLIQLATADDDGSPAEPL